MSVWAGAKPIETVYLGWKFRSRLEARWARFFKELDLDFKYEVEGFDLGGLWYLPDFWLPSLNLWVEVKPEEPTDEENEKAYLLAESTQQTVAICYGIPGEPSSESNGFCPAHYVHRFDDASKSVKSDYLWLWQECPFCHAVGFIDNYIDLPCGCANTIADVYSRHQEDVASRGQKPFSTWLDVAIGFWKEPRVIHSGYDSPRIYAAQEVAKQERFEHHNRGV